MKERSGKDSNVEFQSGATKVPKPKLRPKSIKEPDFRGVDKPYSNPPRKPMMSEQKKATTYTGRVYNPEPKSKPPKKNLPLSGKKKRMDKGRSRLNPFITYDDKKKKQNQQPTHNKTTPPQNPTHPPPTQTTYFFF